VEEPSRSLPAGSFPDRSLGFSLVRGGPFYRVIRSLGLARFDEPDGGRLASLLVAIAWIPLAVLSIVERVRTGRVPPAVVDYAVHIRFLIAIPLFCVAERLLDRRTRRCVDRFAFEPWTEEGEEGVARVAEAAARWRDAIAPEAVLLLAAVLGSQAILWGWAERLGVIRGRSIDAQEVRSSALMLWYWLVSLPLYQFLLYRWLWRWLIWARLLFGLSRLHVRPLATHPDRKGGLGFVSLPSLGFSLVLFGANAVQDGIWADRVRFRHETVASFKGELLVALVAALLLAFGPLLAFSGALWRARLEGLRQYGQLAADHSRQFHARWIVGGRREDLLGAPDISSLADMGTSFDVIRRMRMVPFGVRSIVPILMAVVIPTIPVALMQIPLRELVKRFAAIVLGGT